MPDKTGKGFRKLKAANDWDGILVDAAICDENGARITSAYAKKGDSGLNGKSAYEIAQNHGFTGSESDWLASLQGSSSTVEISDDGYWVINGKKSGTKAKPSDGKSAYEIAKENGFAGTEQKWLDSLVGKSAYDIAKEQGFSGTEKEWVESLKGDEGKSAYEIYKESGGTLSKDGWLKSLKGEDGKSAYEIAKENGYTGTEEEWLESLKGHSPEVKISDDGYWEIDGEKTDVKAEGDTPYIQDGYWWINGTNTNVKAEGTDAKPWSIKKTYSSYNEMISDDSTDVEVGEYAIIEPSDTREEDYGKVYRRTVIGAGADHWAFVLDMSVAGVPGSDAHLWVVYSATEDHSDFNTCSAADAKYVGVSNAPTFPNSPDKFSWTEWKGQPGSDGSSIYVAYATDANGSNFSRSYTGSETYRGFYVAANPTSEQLNNPSNYAPWSKMEPDEPKDPEKPKDPESPINSYFAYATEDDYNNKRFDSTPDGTKDYYYIGTAEGKERPTDFSEYTWVRIKGRDGNDGGSAWTMYSTANSIDGISSANMTDTLTDDCVYIGESKEPSATRSDDPSAYNWRILGKHCYYAYADDVDLTKNPVVVTNGSTTNDSSKKWIGTYYTYFDAPTDYSKYTWYRKESMHYAWCKNDSDYANKVFTKNYADTISGDYEWVGNNFSDADESSLTFDDYTWWKMPKGAPGKDGRSVTSVTNSYDAVGNTVVAINYSDGTSDSFTVQKGQDGSNGKDASDKKPYYDLQMSLKYKTKDGAIHTVVFSFPYNAKVLNNGQFDDFSAIISPIYGNKEIRQNLAVSKTYTVEGNEKDDEIRGLLERMIAYLAVGFGYGIVGKTPPSSYKVPWLAYGVPFDFKNDDTTLTSGQTFVGNDMPATSSMAGHAYYLYKQTLLPIDIDGLAFNAAWLNVSNYGEFQYAYPGKITPSPNEVEMVYVGQNGQIVGGYAIVSFAFACVYVSDNPAEFLASH